jgi:hypothetical protein
MGLRSKTNTFPMFREREREKRQRETRERQRVSLSSTLPTNKRSQVENTHISHVSKTKPLFLRKFVSQVHDCVKSITRRNTTLWSISWSYALRLNQAVQQIHKEK